MKKRSDIKVGKRVATNIRLILKSKNMTQADFAKTFECSKQAITDYLRLLGNGGGTIKTICKYSIHLSIRCICNIYIYTYYFYFASTFCLVCHFHPVRASRMAQE